MRELNAIPISYTEFARVALTYPIVFTSGDKGESFAPVAVLGMTGGENLFVTKDSWAERTYVPAYALNNAFAQVPIVGLILGGGQYGGLFGVNFKVSGSFAQPAVSVNPISALTPGVFRRFFEFSKQSVEGRALIPQRDPARSGD